MRGTHDSFEIEVDSGRWTLTRPSHGPGPPPRLEPINGRSHAPEHAAFARRTRWEARLVEIMPLARCGL